MQPVDSNKVVNVLKQKIADLAAENAFLDVALSESLQRELNMQQEISDLAEERADLIERLDSL